MGEKRTTPEQQRRALFTVPYAPGRLKAVGANGDREVASSVLQTVGDAVRLRLTADRNVLRADGEDLSFDYPRRPYIRGGKDQERPGCRPQPVAELLETRVLDMGFFEDWQVGIGLIPQVEELRHRSPNQHHPSAQLAEPCNIRPP